VEVHAFKLALAAVGLFGQISAPALVLLSSSR